MNLCGLWLIYSYVTQGGCTDCYNARRRMRARQPRVTAHVQSTGTCSGPGSSAMGGLDPADMNDAEDDVLHKVHVMLHTRMDTIRVQVTYEQSLAMPRPTPEVGTIQWSYRKTGTVGTLAKRKLVPGFKHRGRLSCVGIARLYMQNP